VAFDIDPPVVRQINRTRLVDEVTRELRDLISTGELPAGTELRQVEIADRLGVSRTPLREAFRVLEKDGLVRVSGRTGTVEVVQITTESLIAMYQVREVIDGLAARKAASLISESQLTALSGYLDEMRGYRVPFDPARWMEAHIRFHSLIAESSGNPYLSKFLPLIRVSAAALHMPAIRNPQQVNVVATGIGSTPLNDIFRLNDDEHDKLYEALRDHEPQRAESAARRHIRSTLKNAARFDDWRRTIVRKRRQVVEADGSSRG
jgi:GntR family transcriptional regulator of vanillate catabolism